MQHHHPWVNKTNFLREAGSSNSQYFMAPHSSTLAWKIPWMEEPGRLQSMRSLRVRHDWATSLSCIGEGNSNPLQCSCLEIPGMGEPGGLPSMGLHRVEHDWSKLAAAAASIYSLPGSRFPQHSVSLTGPPSSLQGSSWTLWLGLRTCGSNHLLSRVVLCPVSSFST